MNLPKRTGNRPPLHAMRIVPLVIVLATIFAACSGGELDSEAAAARVTELADEYVREFFETFPQAATSEGIANARHDLLNDISPEARAAWEEKEDAWLEKLQAVDGTRLAGHPEGLTLAFLKSRLEQSAGRRVCRMQLWNVSPTFTGWQANVTFLASIQPVETEKERADALKRFRGLPEYVDREIENLRLGLDQGYTAPQNNVRAVVRQMDALLAAPVASSPFMQMAQSGPEDFRSALQSLVQEQIRPAFARYRDFLQEEYLPRARREIGVSANPDGEACYRASVRYWATFDIGADEIHATGLRQMDVIETEMRVIGERSFGVSEPAELMNRVRQPPHLFSSRDEIVSYVEAAVERSRTAVADWFGIVPKARVVVEPYPEWQERSAPGAEYQSPSDDGTRPGIYRVNTYEPTKRSRAGIESTAFHEAYPGHHLQIAIAKERMNLHPVQRYFGPSGFSEGWALYAERLSDEMGIFSSDVDRVGLLSNEALRAARLVVDSGMHALGWTRDQAVSYLETHTAESRASVEAEIDRYIAVPGQATSYMLGNLEIRNLRHLAEERLGGRFEIKEFHDRILQDGGMPLSVLRDRIEGWLGSQPDPEKI